MDGFPYCSVILVPPVTTDGCYPEVAATSAHLHFTPHLQRTPSPYPPDPLLLHKTQLSLHQEHPTTLPNPNPTK